jgi:hypothetical protein
MTMATLDRPRELLARRRGACALCPEAITPGDPITQFRSGWAHSVCILAYRQVFDEHADHDDAAGVREES